MAFKQGQLVRLSGPFTVAGVATDPTSVKISIRPPNGQTVQYVYGTGAEVVKDSTGNYHIDVTVGIPGTWTYWWHSEGTAQAADEKTFIVEPAAAADAPGEPQSLGVDYAQIQRAVGRFLGMGRNSGSWQANERADVSDIIRSGLRRFYWPPPLPIPPSQEGRVVHVSASSANDRPTWSWSFLRLETTLDLAATTETYDLPSDFGELLDGGFTFSDSQQSVAIVGEEQIRQLRSQAPRTGTPKYAAVRAKSGKTTAYEVLFYPTPDAAKTVSYRYSITPNDLSELSPIPYGGPQHAETILEACLAAAEKTLNDTEEVHEKKFLECLTRSIQADKNLTSTDTDVWPLEDPAKGLGITKAYLKRLIGRQLNLGPHQAIWNHAQAAEVDLAVEMGLRKFYNPMVLPNERHSYEWSFLCLVGSIVTNTGGYTYDLPAGFVSMEGPLTYAPDSGYIYPPIQLVAEYQIRLRFQRTVAPGRPSIAALQDKPLDPSGKSEKQLVVWPQPDGAYQLFFSYHVNPGSLPSEATLPHGGPQHAQTVIEACLAAAEELRGVVNGPHAAKFLEYLIASVSRDRKASSPETVGYNRDHSDRPSWSQYPLVPWHEWNANLVTYNGNLY